jgi:hypothetical protein
MKRHRHRLTRTEAIKNRQLQMLRKELEVKRESLTPVALSGPTVGYTPLRGV